MTKTAEIAALDRFIKRLGTDSYLGPWLRDNRTSIVADIGNDLPVDILLPGAAQREAERLLEGARMEASRIRKDAEIAAQSLRSETQRACDTQRQIVADLIRRHAEEAARGLGRL